MWKKFPPRISGIAVLACLAAFGVLGAAEHRGEVRFGGQPVPGATVTATQGDKKVVAISNEQGAYSFLDLAEGKWSIQVEMLSFAPVTRDVVVTPGLVSSAPVEEFDLTLLPLSELTAGATVASGQAQDPSTANPDFKRAGLKASSPQEKPTAEAAPTSAAPALPDANQNALDVFAINGSVNNGAASPFGQSGAFGNNRNAGRSLYNGSLGVIAGNSFWDARSYSLTGQDTPKPGVNHIQAIGSFGGPLRIPHIFNARNAPNFFVGYQLMRNRTATTQPALVPTAEERNGDLSGLLKTAIDPSTGSPFPGNIIPASRINQQAKALLSYYPLPNFTSTGLYNYQIPLVNVTDQDSLQTRVNKSINQRNQVYGSFAWQRTNTQTPSIFGFQDATALTGINSAINWQHRFGQRIFAHVQFQYSRFSTRTTPFFQNRENVSGNAGIRGNNQEPVDWGPPQLTFSSGITGLSDTNSSFNRNQTGALAFDTLWNRRSHNMTFGADYKKLQFNSLGQQNPRGTFTFTGAAAGNDFAGFLLGVPDASSLAFGNADKYFRSSGYDGYFTDDWRVGPGLSLNLGARWEYSAPITELQGRLVNLDIAPGYGTVSPVVAANPSGTVTGRRYPDSLVHPDKHIIQPRLGMSWRPFGGSSMVVRAGYGVTEDTSVYQSIATQMAQQSPLSKSFSVQNSPNDPLSLANGFNPSSTITQNTFAVDPNFHVGYAHTWQVSVQRDLPLSLVMSATYLGIKGTRAQQEFLPNTYPAGAVNPCASCPSGYIYLTSNGNSTRESGVLQLRRRLHNGVTAALQYTYSKSIDDASLGGKGLGTAVIAQNWLDLNAERGLSSFDQRHLVNVQLQYSTGVGLGGGTLMSGWRGTLFKEWTFTTQITAGTGLPQSPVYLSVVQGTGVTGPIRPDYTGAPLYAGRAGLFLNPAAYTAPALGRWGNAGRNTITGPDQFTLNASMGRTFRLRDKLNADFRFDATNALNHVTFTGWNTTINSPLFGFPMAANAARTMQATFRVRF